MIDVPVALAMTAVAHLISDHRLVPHSPIAYPDGPSALDQVLDWLQGRPPQCQTTKLLTVAPHGEGVLRHLLSQVGTVYTADTPASEADPVLHSLQRISNTLNLAMTGVQGLPTLVGLWPDLARDAEAALLLVNDTDLAQGADSAAMLTNQEELPLVVVVHLASEHDLDAHQVRDALSLAEHVPVVMVDATDPSCLLMILREVRLHRSRTEAWG
ncbi:hypothetical protein [Nocardiopsis nanhaiensis]